MGHSDANYNVREITHAQTVFSFGPKRCNHLWVSSLPNCLRKFEDTYFIFAFTQTVWEQRYLEMIVHLQVRTCSFYALFWHKMILLWCHEALNWATRTWTHQLSPLYSWPIDDENDGKSLTFSKMQEGRYIQGLPHGFLGWIF